MSATLEQLADRKRLREVFQFFAEQAKEDVRLASQTIARCKETIKRLDEEIMELEAAFSEEAAEQLNEADRAICSRCGENEAYEGGLCWDCLDG